MYKLYSLNQVLELRVIAALRTQLSMQEIRKVVSYIRAHEFDRTLFGKFLIFCEDQLYWIHSGESLEETIIKLTGKNRGQLILKAVHPIGDILSDLQEEIKRRNSVTKSLVSCKL